MDPLAHNQSLNKKPPNENKVKDIYMNKNVYIVRINESTNKLHNIYNNPLSKSMFHRISL